MSIFETPLTVVGPTGIARDAAAPAGDNILANHPAADRPKSLAAAVELPPLLVDTTGLSRLLARSRASLARDEAAGRLPAALRIGGGKRWRLSEIRDWVEAGCPSRRVWEAMRAAANARGQR